MTLSDDQIREILALEARATRGPWRWNLNRKHKSVHLEGLPTRGLETVFDVVRWSMGSAKLRFREACLMVDCDEMAKPFDGRKHHESWYADIDHPDAQMIVSARNHIAELCREVLALRAAARMALDYCECRNPAVPASPSAAEVRKALRDCLEVL